MILHRVNYALFPNEIDILGEYRCPGEHLLDRELRMEFESGLSQYVSWVSEPVQFSVGVSDHTFFERGEAIIYDASNHPFWSGLIGKEVEITVVAAKSQAIKIRSGQAAVFILSCEYWKWESDTLTITDKQPSYVP